mgnify:CR=1 FL=1
MDYGLYHGKNITGAGCVKNGKEVSFVKGHMGGNEIVLVPRREFPRGTELSAGLTVLEPNSVGGDQLGLLYEGTEGSDLRAKIIDRHSQNYIQICGGLTQVLGRALYEGGLLERFDLGLPGGPDELGLETDIGVFAISLEPGGVVTSEMDPFLDYVYNLGVESGRVSGVLSYRVGDFFVAFESEIKTNFPEVSLDRLDDATKEVLVELQRNFSRKFTPGKDNRDFAVLGAPEIGSNRGRLIFPHRISEGLIEPACGTGTIAAAIGLVEEGLASPHGRYKL